MGSTVVYEGNSPLVIRLDVTPETEWERSYLRAELSFTGSLDAPVYADPIGPAGLLGPRAVGDWREKWYRIAEQLNATLILDDDVTDIQAETDPEYGA